MRSSAELLSLLDLETIEDNLFRGAQGNTSLQRVFGGQVLAQSLVAASRTVDPDRPVHSLHSYFLRPGDTAVPIVYDVDAIRDGGSFSTRRVVARQHGRAIFYLSASFQVEEQGLDHQDPPPVVPPPEQCRDPAVDPATPEQQWWVQEWAAVDLRQVRDPGAVDAHASRGQWWMRFSGDLPDDPVHQRAAFTYASDMHLLPATVADHREEFTDEQMQMASLDHSIWFHRPFRADRWWLYDQISPSASGGRGLALGRVFQDGAHVATVAQEGLIRVRH